MKHGKSKLEEFLNGIFKKVSNSPQKIAPYHLHHTPGNFQPAFLFLFWRSKQFIYPTCSELVIFMCWTIVNQWTTFFHNYCGLVDPRLSASEKNLAVTFKKKFGLRIWGFNQKHMKLFSPFFRQIEIKILYANSERIWPHFVMYCPHSVLSPAKTRREMCISIDLSSKHLDSKRDWPILPYFS